MRCKSFGLSVDDIDEVIVVAFFIVFFADVLHQLVERTFFPGSFDQQRQVHAIGLGIPPSQFTDDDIDSDVVRGFELRKTILFYLFPIVGTEQIIQQL